MQSHTTGYPADEPSESSTAAQSPASPRAHQNRQYFVEDQSSSNSNMPFRIVAFTEGGNAPYPLHDSPQPSQQQYMVDLISGDRFQRHESIRQPDPKDYMRRYHPLPPPPVEIHEEDQDLPIIEPGIYDHLEIDTTKPGAYLELDFRDHEPKRPQSAAPAVPGRCDSIAPVKPLTLSKPDSAHRRSKSAANIPVLQTEDNESPYSANKVPSIAPDEFSPVLGGLHRLPSAPIRKPSRIRRLKRFFSGKKR